MAGGSVSTCHQQAGRYSVAYGMRPADNSAVQKIKTDRAADEFTKGEEMSETFRAKFKCLVASSDRLEFDQAVVRVSLAGFALVYVAWYVTFTTRGDGLSGAYRQALGIALGYLGLSVMFLLLVLAGGKPSALRRLVAMAVDTTVITYCLIRMGESSAVILFGYLYIIFGNGFRYGRWYLHASQAMAFVGFIVVLFASEFWPKHLWIGLGFLMGLIIIPFYVGALSQRIIEEKNRADEVNAQRARAYDEVVAAMRDGQRSIAECVDCFHSGNETFGAAALFDKLRAANLRMLELISKHGSAASEGKG